MFPCIAQRVAQSAVRRAAARSFVSATRPDWAAQTINVPTMGDSITEGTVVEWLVKPGQAVQSDDVVAMVETDKVTIEIKADRAGVLSQQFVAVDETVEVGAPLYEIDSDATATVESSSSPSSSSTPAAAPFESKEPPKAKSTPKAEPAKLTPTKQHRTPSIHFLGKEGWAVRLTPPPALPPITPQYGRPAWTEEEMEALVLGGADQAPKIKNYSGGAQFSY